MDTVRSRLEEIRGRIDGATVRSGRLVGSVKLVAVSKKQPIERVVEAYEAGQRVFGENYVQELARKREVIPEATWHLIGHLQSNKAKQAVSVAQVVETVDSAELAGRLDRLAAAAGRRLPVLLEVRLGGEEAKSGVEPSGVEGLVRAVIGMSNLELLGLMSVPEPTESRRWFAELRRLRERVSLSTGAPLPELSMGMSGDFEDAILEGATIVRIGTALFGSRSG
ncbi:MAG: YggS family pyridoxal phosphate-dependent enzyme [Deltaproteobacteria bacterium]|nr:YggS family pyridoxal phosphate-dependent enzyme [Deltaproteobacteria bacterium]